MILGWPSPGRAAGLPVRRVSAAADAAPGALDGVRVLDLSAGIAGSVAGLLLADLGADVVRVRPAAHDVERGDPLRHVLDRNKCQVILSPDSEPDLDALDSLVEGADIVLTVPTCDGITESDLRQRGHAPGQPATWIALPPYLSGDTPWHADRESAGSIFAWLGHAWNQASYADVPVDCIYPMALYMQGIWAATSAVALLAARQSGRHVPLRAVVGGAQGGMLISPGAFAVARDEQHIHRPGGPGGVLPNYRCYRCSDGTWLFFGAFTAEFIRRGLEATGAPHILDDPRVAGNPDHLRLPENVPWVTGELQRIFGTRPRDEWLSLLDSADVPAAPALRTEDWLDHEQVRALGLRAEVRDDAGELVVMPGLFVELSQTPGSLRHAAASRYLPVTAVATRWPRQPDFGPAGEQPLGAPLSGMRVLDLGTIIAGPYVAALLAELGAAVVKVERPPHGDEFRVAHGGRGGASFPVYDRNRRSLMMDIAADDGRAAFLRLVRSADVVVDNYRPGVRERLGIGHAQLAAVNERICNVSVSAFGEVGPLGRRPGFDPVVQALSGIMRSQGGPDEANSPVFLTVPINDVIAAALGAFGACAALLARGRTGHGQQVSVTLCAASCLLQAESLVRRAGRAAPVLGSRDHPGARPLNRLYKALDGWIRMDGRWPDDLPGLIAAGLAKHPGEDGLGAVDPDQVGEAVARQIVSLTVTEVLARSARANVPAVKARQAHEVAADEQLLRRGLLTPLPHDAGRAQVTPGRWIELPGLALAPVGDAPAAGQDSSAVLREIGIPEHEIRRLIRSGVVIESRSPSMPGSRE